MGPESAMRRDAREPKSAPELLRGIRLNDQETFVSQIYRILRELIVAVELRPHQRLSEIEISDALQASKTPVREALIRLEDVGLVKIVPKSGTYVTAIKIERYVEACFVRLQLEIGAARRAAGRNLGATDLAGLDAILADQVQAIETDDYVAFFALDELLHRTMFDVAGVGGVWQTVKRSQADVDRIRHLKRIYNIRRGPQVIEEHKAIVQAIRAGSPDAAERALVAHLKILEEEIEGLSRYPVLLDYIESLNTQPNFRRARRA